MRFSDCHEWGERGPGGGNFLVGFQWETRVSASVDLSNVTNELCGTYPLVGQ